MLSLIIVSVHDFGGDDGSAQREALLLLRTAVVADTARVGDAWNALCEAAMDERAGQSGLDRRAAQQVLRRESIPLVAPRSYRKDIATLAPAPTDPRCAHRPGGHRAPHGRAKIAREAPKRSSV